jgi:hypothetical protein
MSKINARIMTLIGMTGIVMSLVSLTAIGGSDAATTQAGERMTSYRAHTGPELTPTEATNIAVSLYARDDGKVFGALDVVTVHANLAENLAVAEGHTVTDAIYGGPADVAEWRLSPTYLVSMRAPAGSSFSPNVPHPPSTSPPTGSVMTVILDAHTGWRVSMNLEQSMPPSIDELGPQLHTQIGAITSFARIAGPPLGNVGEVSGYVAVKKHREAGWKVTARRKGTTVQVRRASKGGVFVFRLTPGTYTLSAVSGRGRRCGSRKVKILRHRETTANLICR